MKLLPNDGFLVHKLLPEIAMVTIFSFFDAGVMSSRGNHVEKRIESIKGVSNKKYHFFGLKLSLPESFWKMALDYPDSLICDPFSQQAEPFELSIERTSNLSIRPSEHSCNSLKMASEKRVSTARVRD